MNNYINVRVQAHNHTKTFNSIKHNLRAIGSLNQNINSSNSNYILIDNKLTKLDKSNIKEMYKNISATYQSERLEHNAIYKAHNKRNLRDIKSTWCEGVFTFSEQMKDDIKNQKYTYNDLFKVANECLKEIAQTYDTKINYMVLHLDETTPHFHFSFSNFDEKGMSLFHTNKNKDFLSNLQNIGFKHFSKLGMERGVSKEISGVNHKDINKFWKQKNIEQKQQFLQTKEIVSNQSKQLNIINDNIITLTKKESGLNDLLNNINKQIESDKLLLEDISTQIKDLKVEREKTTKDLDLSKSEKKKIYDDITNQQIELRKLKEEIKLNIETNKGFKTTLDNKIENILSKAKTFVGYDSNVLKNEITTLVNQYSKYDLQLKEAISFKETNATLTKEVEVLKASNSLINKEKQDLKVSNNLLKEDNKKIDTMATNIKNLVNENKEQKETFNKKLEDLSSTLGVVEYKLNQYRDYIKDNGLSKDFEKYKEQKDKETLEEVSKSTKSFNHHR